MDALKHAGRRRGEGASVFAVELREREIGPVQARNVFEALVWGGGEMGG